MDEPFKTTVHTLAEHVSAGIEQACLNGGSWDDVTRIMTEAIPGSRSSIVGFSKKSGDINFQSTHNLEEKYVKSYRDYYWYRNPWNDFWAKAETGILIAEEAAPVRQYHHTEFYTDWLRPQRVFDAGACIRVGSDPDTIVYAAVQFDLKQQERFGPALRTFFEGIHGTFRRALQLARMLRAAAEGVAAEAALVERSRCAAFVVDSVRQVREANQIAVQLFSSGKALAVRNGRCHLSDKDADARFGAALDTLSKGVPTDGSGIVLKTAAGAWKLTMAPLPVVSAPTGVLSLLPPQRMVLVLVTDLGLGVGSGVRSAGDFSALAGAFGLAPAEIAFCRRMFLGESVSDAADHLGITVETARTRLKTILHKTGTSRQGQLMLLLAKLQ